MTNAELPSHTRRFPAVQTLAAVVVAVAVTLYVVSLGTSTEPPSTPDLSSSEKAFLSVCSSVYVLDGSPTIQLFAQGVCLARIQGFLDGYSISGKMNVPGKRRCFPDTLTPKEVYDITREWTMSRPADQVVAFPVALTAALYQKFGC